MGGCPATEGRFPPPSFSLSPLLLKEENTLAGNPNCGKTTLFNALTGSNQYVGNWPGVTVEKKEGKLKGHKEVVIQDLPGIYSLSPYTLEEVVARNYLVNEKPDAILNIVDGTNIERNLYLTTQLIELGLPVVVAVNMMDLVRKNGDKIDLQKLGQALGCQVVEMSALKGEGGMAAAERAVPRPRPTRPGSSPTCSLAAWSTPSPTSRSPFRAWWTTEYLRWYAIKVFERDEKVLESLTLTKDLRPTWRPTSPTVRTSWTTTLRASSPTSAMRTSTLWSTGR